MQRFLKWNKRRFGLYSFRFIARKEAWVTFPFLVWSKYGVCFHDWFRSRDAFLRRAQVSEHKLPLLCSLDFSHYICHNIWMLYQWYTRFSENLHSLATLTTAVSIKKVRKLLEQISWIWDRLYNFHVPLTVWVECDYYWYWRKECNVPNYFFAKNLNFFSSTRGGGQKSLASRMKMKINKSCENETENGEYGFCVHLWHRAGICVHPQPSICVHQPSIIEGGPAPTNLVQSYSS